MHPSGRGLQALDFAALIPANRTQRAVRGRISFSENRHPLFRGICARRICDPGGGVKPAAFAYAKARSLDDAIRLMGEHSMREPLGEARLLAGGQSLIATLNMRLSHPS